MTGVERWMRITMFWATFLTMWWKNMRIPCTLGGAFMQVFSWQYQTMHEGAETYYSNEYGDSDYVTITRVTVFLRENGYDEIAEPYGLAAADCEQYQYPEDKIDLLPDDWLETHEQVIWDFYVDILEKHKEDFA